MKVELILEYEPSVLAELDERQPTPESVKRYLLEVLRDRREGPAGLEPLGQAILAAEGFD